MYWFHVSGLSVCTCTWLLNVFDIEKKCNLVTGYLMTVSLWVGFHILCIVSFNNKKHRKDSWIQQFNVLNLPNINSGTTLPFQN